METAPADQGAAIDLWSAIPAALYRPAGAVGAFIRRIHKKEKPMRLGDDIDDHCSRCKRTTDHSVVSMMGEEVLRTRCRTCNSEHKYRQNKSRSKEMTAKEAFDKVLASVTGAQPETPSTAKKKKE